MIRKADKINCHIYVWYGLVKVRKSVTNEESKEPVRKG